MPDDLEATLALAGVAGPANTALRALARGKSYTKDLADLRIRDGACRIAWGFRSLFAVPEVMSMVRGTRGSESTYWRRILAYCLDGNLQAVLDEYGHILPDWLGKLQQLPVDRAHDVAKGMYAALAIRAPGYGYDAIRADGRRDHDQVPPDAVAVRAAVRRQRHRRGGRRRAGRPGSRRPSTRPSGHSCS